MFLFFVVFSQYLYLSLSKINVHCAQLLWQHHITGRIGSSWFGESQLPLLHGVRSLSTTGKQKKVNDVNKSRHMCRHLFVFYIVQSLFRINSLILFQTSLISPNIRFPFFLVDVFYKVLILIKCCSDLRVEVKMFPSCCVRGRLKIGPTSNIAFYHHQHFPTQENWKFSFPVNLGSFTAQKEFILFLTNVNKFFQVKSVKRKSSWNVFPPKVRKSLHYGKEENCDGWRAVLQMSVPFPFSSPNDIYLYLQTLNLLLYVFLDALASLRPVLCHSLSD